MLINIRALSRKGIFTTFLVLTCPVVLPFGASGGDEAWYV